jgi:hypothetical protein
MAKICAAAQAVVSIFTKDARFVSRDTLRFFVPGGSIVYPLLSLLTPRCKNIYLDDFP